MKLDSKTGPPADTTGSAEAKMGTYNTGRVSDFVVGAFGEVST